MRSRAGRGTQGNRRKAIGAVVIGGVLVAAGLTGVQLASASTTPTAADIVTVDGQQFDVSQCEKLEVNGGEVICDGEQLAPEQAQNANDAALASAQALEAACDTFAADVVAAEGQNAEDQNAQDQNAEEQAAADQAAAEANAAKSKAEIKKSAKKWAKAMDAADEQEAADGAAAEDENAGAAEDENAGAAEDENAGAADDAAAADAAEAVTTAQGSLLQACLTLAQIKAVAAGAGAADDQQAGEEQGAADQGNADEQDAADQGNAHEQPGAVDESAKAKN